MKKFATWAFTALVVWWVVQDPASAASLVHTVAGFFNHAATSLSSLTSSGH